MQLCLLHLDDALDTQPAFVRACEADRAQRLHVDGRTLRLWGFHEDIAAFREQVARSLNTEAGPRLTFMGSGDFHHISALLLERALEHHVGPVTLIHVDNHPDWVTFHKGSHCGSWINAALEIPQVRKVITVGVCSHDLEEPEPKLANLALLSEGRLELYPYDHAPSRVRNNYGAGASFEQVDGQLCWKTIKSMGEQNFIDCLLSRIDTDAVYLTIDKDALTPEYAVTNWDQGLMRLPYLLSMIAEIGRKHRIVGADVIGDYSRPKYSGSLRSIASKYYERLKDQALLGPNPRQAAEINSEANFALLRALSQVM